MGIMLGSTSRRESRTEVRVRGRMGCAVSTLVGMMCGGRVDESERSWGVELRRRERRSGRA